MTLSNGCPRCESVVRQQVHARFHVSEYKFVRRHAGWVPLTGWRIERWGQQLSVNHRGNSSSTHRCKLISVCTWEGEDQYGRDSSRLRNTRLSRSNLRISFAWISCKFWIRYRKDRCAHLFVQHVLLDITFILNFTLNKWKRNCEYYPYDNQSYFWHDLLLWERIGSPIYNTMLPI